MPRFDLTDRFIRHAKARERTEYFDNAVRGLALRVSKESKSWYFHYTAGRVRKRLGLGTYPAVGLAKARTLATEARGLVQDGLSPAGVAKANTLKAVTDDYLARATELRSLAERRSAFERLVYPSLGAVPIDQIRRSDIIQMLDRIEDENGPVMADNTLAFLRRVMNWYASRSDEFRSPIVRGMARTKPKERARQRTLADDELRPIWRTAEANGVFGAFVRFLLLTAARRSEAAEMQWSEIAGSDWTLPASRNKTKLDLVRPLSKAALELLPVKRGEFVFSFTGRVGLTSLSRFKDRFDKACGITGWTIHDLRRTARSLMSRAGVPSDHAERCLGHVIGGVRGVYDRHEYHAEKARAYEALATQIERIVRPQDNVVSLKGSGR
jgi:integrase